MHWKERDEREMIMENIRSVTFRKKATRWLRIGIQVLFFLTAPAAFSSAFSGIKEIFTAFSQGAELQMTSFAKILLFLLIFTIVFGRFFCGYACAFGAVGDWIYMFSCAVQKRIIKKKVPRMPEQVQVNMQYVKYILSSVVVLLCFAGHQQLVNQDSPWTVFSFLSSFQMPRGDVAVGSALLASILAGMALQERFFCQFLCPMGAVFALLPILPFGQLRRDRERCRRGCRACSKTCPVALGPEMGSARSGECIRCGRCADACPGKNISIGGLPLRGSEPAWVVLQAALLLVGMFFLKR